jgi:hypothetical protein
MRTATVDSPAVTAAGIRGLAGSSRVRGPGQKAAMSLWYCLGRKLKQVLLLVPSLLG